MSRSRIKNISFEGDDYVDDQDDYEDGDELSPEDRERMRACTAQARDLLGSEIPPIPASDEEIWEALWHYYYDVDRSVGYLRSTCGGSSEVWTKYTVLGADAWRYL